MASCDPIESPSGRACDDRTNRWRARIASTIDAISGAIVLGLWCVVDLVEQLLDPVLPGDRLVVGKDEFRHAPQTQAGSDLAPQKRRRAGESLARIRAGFVVTQRGVEDAPLRKIRWYLHARQRP